MSTGSSDAAPVAIPPLPPVDPTKHPKLAAILKLIRTFGPWVIALLKGLGVNVPVSLPGAQLDLDAAEASLSHVDLAHLEDAVKQAGC